MLKIIPPIREIMDRVRMDTRATFVIAADGETD